MAKSRKDNGMAEHESLEYFKRIVPRNPHDWHGGVVLYSTWANSFFNVVFGEGDNLDDGDIDQGCDDYIMVDQYCLSGKRKLEDIILEAKNAGYVDESTPGLEQVDGGQWLLKHKEWGNGDIRRFLMEALTFAGYGVPEGRLDGMYRDIVYVGADYDIWHADGKNKVKKGTRA